MFGISPEPEKYQHVFQQVLQGLDGVRNISDDVAVHGADDEGHDDRLQIVLQRLQEKGLTLNLDKCRFRMPRVGDCLGL